MSRLDTRARRLLELRAENETAQSEAKAAKEKLDNYELEFWSELEDLRLKSFTMDDGTRLERRETRYARVLDLEALTEWVVENGLAAELLKDAPRKAVLNKFVRTRQENGQPLPPGLDFTTDRYISVRQRRK